MKIKANSSSIFLKSHIVAQYKIKGNSRQSNSHILRATNVY